MHTQDLTLLEEVEKELFTDQGVTVEYMAEASDEDVRGFYSDLSGEQARLIARLILAARNA